MYFVLYLVNTVTLPLFSSRSFLWPTFPSTLSFFTCILYLFTGFYLIKFIVWAFVSVLYGFVIHCGILSFATVYLLTVPAPGTH